MIKMNMNNLYRQVIMDHYKSPKNKGLVNDAGYLTVTLNNPSCGDTVFMQLKLEDDVLVDIRHEGTGCSICCSAASVISDVLKNKTKADALKILEEYHYLIQGKEYDKELLKNDLIVYEGVSQFPARVKCATLASKAVEKGLVNKEE